MKLFFCIFTISIIAILFASSCKTKQKAVAEQIIPSLTEKDIQNLPKVLEFSKSACRGQCPYFNLTVFQDGHIIFEGKRHTQHIGKAIDQLSNEEFAQLKNHCKVADLWNCQPAYGMNIMDIPTTTVHFYEKDKDRIVKWRMRAPKQLPTLSMQIMELIYARNWVERIEKNKDRGIKLPAGMIKDELIIQFKEKINIEEWCQQYERYGLKSKKALSASTPIYLMTFDREQMPPDKMLKIINNDKKVATAEFNKRVETRGRN